MLKYRLWTYEVWGNAKDGYEVNNRFKRNIVELPDDFTDSDVIKVLKAEGEFRRNIHHKNIEIDGEAEYTLYVNYVGRRLGGLYPVCELVRENEDE